jgi:hypothetical protein
MARRLFTVLSALSLLLCAASALLWIDGRLAGKQRGKVFGSLEEGIMVANGPQGTLLAAGSLRSSPAQTTYQISRVPGVYYRFTGAPLRQYLLHVRHWLGFALTALLPASWVARRLLARARGRDGPEACRLCGHDLRATPERCPECGTVAGKQA